MNTQGESFINMELNDLLMNKLTFVDYQALADCLGYDCQIHIPYEKVRGLKEVKYEKQNKEGQQRLDQWAKSEEAVNEIIRQIQNAASPIWGATRTYTEILKEIIAHLEIKELPGKSLDDCEQTILRQILLKMLEKIDRLSEDEKAKFNKEMGAFLKQKGVELGTVSAVDYLKAGGTGIAATLAGTQIVTAIILAHLGIYHAALFAVGLFAVPTALIASVIGAPVAAAILVYYLGQHNFKKTIPCVAIIASLRQEAILTNNTIPK